MLEFRIVEPMSFRETPHLKQGVLCFVFGISSTSNGSTRHLTSPFKLMFSKSMPPGHLQFIANKLRTQLSVSADDAPLRKPCLPDPAETGTFSVKDLPSVILNLLKGRVCSRLRKAGSIPTRNNLQRKLPVYSRAINGPNENASILEEFSPADADPSVVSR